MGIISETVEGILKDFMLSLKIRTDGGMGTKQKKVVKCP